MVACFGHEAVGSGDSVADEWWAGARGKGGGCHASADISCTLLSCNLLSNSGLLPTSDPQAT